MLARFTTVEGKRGLAAPLLFLAFALAARGSGEPYVLYWFASIVALFLGGALIRESSVSGRCTPMAIGLALFVAWMVGTNLWANPSYSVVVPFHAALLFGGFLLGRVAGIANSSFLFRVGLVFALALALGGLGLQFAMSEPRAHSLFVTPATLASALNLFLLPALVVAALGEPRFSLLAVVFFLSAAFAAAQSRGGWVALGLAALFAFLLARRAGVSPDRSSLARTTIAFTLGVFAWWTIALVWIGEAGLHAFVDEAAPSFQARLDLYRLAWRGIEHAPLLLGSGYQAFYYLLVGAAGSIPHYVGKTTYFVHNDYLQILLELGIPGLLGFGLLTILPLVLAARAAPRISRKDEAMVLIALAAAIASLAVHALVDFPFYIPLCALVFGVLLGLSDAALIRSTEVRTWSIPPGLVKPAIRRALIAGIATVVAWMLVVPAAAEAAATYALREWRHAHGQSAAYWYEFARRLEPRDWRYHWYAGQFWRAQALEAHSAEAARFADRAFAAGYAANSRDGRNLYGLLVTHRQLRDLLEKPADRATMLAWAERLAQLAPDDPVVRAEKALVLQEFGNPK